MKGLLGKLAIVAILLLFTSAAGLQARPYSEQVRSAVTGLFNIPQVAQRLIWANGGIALKDLMTLIQTLEPDTYRLLRSDSVIYKYSEEEPELHLLEMVIRNELGDEVFALHRPSEIDDSYVPTYFWGKKPDIRSIVDEIVFSKRLIKKLKWDKGGLSNDRILQEIEMAHPAVYNLYVQSTANKDDQWLRDIITGRIHSRKGKKNLGQVFTKRMRDHTGKPTYIYYRGEEPNTFRHLLRVISTDDLRDLMKHGRLGKPKGATMDQILDVFRKHEPYFYSLYTHFNKGSLIREAVAYASGSDINMEDAIRRHRIRREHGLRSMLGRLMSDSKTFIKGKNSDGETTYRTTMMYIGDGGRKDVELNLEG